MQRYKKCTIRVNKELVKREIIYKYGSVTRYCRFVKISQVRFWEILRTPHLSKQAECLQRLARDLNLSIDTILM